VWQNKLQPEVRVTVNTFFPAAATVAPQPSGKHQQLGENTNSLTHGSDLHNTNWIEPQTPEKIKTYNDDKRTENKNAQKVERIGHHTQK
jgi:hypothetical protein